MNITENELLAAVRKAMEAPTPDGTQGFTVLELATALDRSTESVRPIIKGMLANGAAEVVRIRRPRMDGIIHTISGYRLKK